MSKRLDPRVQKILAALPQNARRMSAACRRLAKNPTQLEAERLAEAFLQATDQMIVVFTTLPSTPADKARRAALASELTGKFTSAPVSSTIQKRSPKLPLRGHSRRESK